jgi:ATP-dependent Lon protease
MTGELTLRGRVLPIGGLKEKLLAAVGAGMRLAIIPAQNAPELSEIPEHVKSRIRIEPVRTMEEVIPLALVRAVPKTPVRKGGKAAPEVVTPATPNGRGSA